MQARPRTRPRRGDFHLGQRHEHLGARLEAVGFEKRLFLLRAIRTYHGKRVDEKLRRRALDVVPVRRKLARVEIGPQHVHNAVAVETPRGFRLAKEKTTAKIDGAVALSMAHWGARELYGPSRDARVTIGPNPFYGEVAGEEPTPRESMFDSRGWYTGEHVQGVTWKNCKYRNRGCYACEEEWQAENS